MRLVIATPLYPPEPGGPATYTATLERELPSIGIETTVVKFSSVRYLPKLIRHFAYYRRVLHAAQTADAVLALDPVSTGLPAMNAARQAGKKFFIKIVGDYAWEQGQQRFGVTSSLDEFQKTPARGFVKHLKHIQTQVTLAADAVIVPSAYLKGIVAGWGVPEEKIHVIHNAVSVEQTGTIDAYAAMLPHPKVVTVGRLVPWKGIRGLIDAVAVARKTIPGLGLVVIGEGPERETLEAHAHEVLGVGYVFTGALSHEDTLATMQDTDIFTLNTSYEGFSHLLLEASLLHMPIVTTKSGGNTELLTQDSALFAEVNAVEEIAAHVVRLLTEPGLKEKLSTAAYSYVQQTFDASVLVRKLKDVLT